MPTHDRINGSMLLLLQKYMISSHDVQTWQNILEAAGVGEKNYDTRENYPLAELNSLLESTTAITGISPYAVKEGLGEFIVPDLLTSFNKYVDPTWRTYDMLLHTEQVMHTAVRTENDKSNPPSLNVTKVSENVLVIDYYSKRRMASLAMGIIRGIAKHYKESDRVTIVPKSDPDDERVQIRVEFK